jgi:hypothetical protein
MGDYRDRQASHGPRRNCCNYSHQHDCGFVTLLAASDAEIGGFGEKMSGAFRCSTYAQLFHDEKEQQRLFQIGLRAGRDFVEGLKSRDDPAMGEMSRFIRGVSRLCGRPDVRSRVDTCV